MANVPGNSTREGSSRFGKAHPLPIASLLHRYFLSPLLQTKTACHPPMLPLDPATPERWPSGRRHTPAKGADGQLSRGFESLPLRHLPPRKRSPDPAVAGFSRCFRGLCAVSFALAPSLQQPEWFSEARYSPDLSTARIRCRARNRLTIWGQFLAPPEHFEAGGVREMEQKSNSCNELQSDRGSALRSDRICRQPGMFRSRVLKKSSSCRGETKWASSCRMT